VYFRNEPINIILIHVLDNTVICYTFYGVLSMLICNQTSYCMHAVETSEDKASTLKKPTFIEDICITDAKSDTYITLTCELRC